MAKAPPNELQRLLPRHFQIIDLSLAGYGPKEIAQAMDMTPQAISLITNSPLFQDEISRRRESIEKETNSNLASIPMMAKKALEASSLQAANTLVYHLNSPDPKAAISSANSILDRVFGKKDDQSSQQVVILEAGALQVLQVTMKELENYDRERKGRLLSKVGIEGQTRETKASGGALQDANLSREQVASSGILQAPQELEEPL